MAKKKPQAPKKTASPKAPATPKKPKVVQSPEEIKQAKDAAAVQKLLGKDDVAGAKALSDSFVQTGSLGRVGSGFDENGNRVQENQDILNRLRGNMEARGPGGGAVRSADVQDVINRSRANVDRSPEAIAALKGITDRVGRSADTQSLLDQSRGRIGRTGDTSDYLSRMRDATAGYSSAENQAMLEQQMSGINQGFQNQSARLAQKAGSLGVRGGTLAALQGKIGKQAARGEAEERQKIFIKNADEKQARLKEYGSALSGVEAADKTRFDSYGNLLSGTEKDEFGRASDANTATSAAELADRNRLDAYGKNVGDAEAGEYDRARQSTGDYYDTLSKTRTDELDRQKTNLDQVSAENAGKIQTFFSGLTQGRGNRNEEESRKLNRGYLNLARSQAGGGRGGGKGGSAKAPFDYEGYYNDKRKLIEGS